MTDQIEELLRGRFRSLSPSALPLGLRFAALPALAMLLVVGLLFVTTLVLVQRENDRAAAVRVEQRAALLAERIRVSLANRILQVRQLANQLGLSNLSDAEAVRRELEWLQSQADGYAWIGLVMLDGRVVAGTRGWLEGRSIGNRPVFLQALGQPFFADFHPAVVLAPLMAPAQQPPPSVADIGMPVMDSNGRQVAVLAAHLDARWIERIADRTVSPKETEELGFTWALFNQDNQPIGRPSALAISVEQLRLQGITEFTHEDVRHIAATHRLRADASSPVNWRAVVSLDLDVAQQTQRALILTLASVTLLSALGVGVAVWLVSRHFTRPYQRLLDAVSRRYVRQSSDSITPPLPFGHYLESLSQELQDRPASADDPAARLLNALSRDADQLSQLLDALPMGVCMVDGEDRLLFVNDGFVAMFGLPEGEVAGRPLKQVLPGLRRGSVDHWSIVTQLHRPDGRALQVRTRTLPLHNERGQDAGAALVIEDVTQEAAALQRLQESQERFAAIIDSASDAIISTSVEGEVQLFNPAAERIFQRAAAEQVGQPLDALLPPQARGAHGTFLGQFARSGVTRRSMGAGTVQGLRADGQTLELEASISQASVRGKQVLTAILRDVTERRRVERQLNDYQAQLADLAQRLLRQEKDTTQQLAQSLHDELGQTLSALRMICETQQQRLRESGLPQPALERLHGLIVEANVQVRQVLARLRPPLLDEQGLGAALDNECRQQAQRFPDVHLRLQQDDGSRWPPDVEYAAFMIAREALANALLHAQPSQVDITLEGDGDHLVLAVSDDGTGCEGLDEIVRPGHLGLVGMRERAAAAAGRLTVESAPQHGTRVRFEWSKDDGAHPGGG